MLFLTPDLVGLPTGQSGTAEDDARQACHEVIAAPQAATATKESGPLVSVIMVFWNAARFMREAIESVLAQSFRHWELLLVDDGACDGSSELARQYAARYPERVRYLEQPGHRNLGMSAARNLGLGSARGEFITFLDADDVFLPRALEQMTSHLQEHPEAGAIRGRFQFWYSWTGDTHDLTRDFIPDVGLPPNTLFEPPALLSLTYPLGPALSPGVAAVMVRRPVVDRIGGFDAPFRGSGEDQVFYFKLHVKERLFVSDGCWFRYRQHPDSCCARARRTDDYTWWPLMLDWLERYLVQEGVGDVAVWKAVRSWRLLPYRHPALYRLGFKLARWAPITSFYRWLFWGPSQAMLCGKTQPSGSGATLPPAP